MPVKKAMPIHVSEVIQQIEGAGVPEGGWVGGDAWFGSVTFAIELKQCMRGVESTFVVKQNTAFFPKEQLEAVLRSQHSRHPQGHWVVFKAMVAEVDLIAVA